MATYDFDMRFTFIYAGWEETANDLWIMANVVYNPKWSYPHAPPGAFYIKKRKEK